MDGVTMDGENNFGEDSVGTVEGIVAADFICYHPYLTTSRGIWTGDLYEVFSVPLFLRELLVIYALMQLVHFILKRLRQPKIVSQILTGVILGQSVLSRNKKFNFLMYPMQILPILSNFAEVGFMIFQFLLGVKMDPSMILTTGRKSLVIGILSFLIPLTLTTSASVIMGNQQHMKRGVQRMLIFVGAAQSMTTFPVISSILSELKLLNSELGRLALSSSMISDLSYSFVNMVSTNWKLDQQGLKSEALYAVVCILVFVAVVVFVIRPVLIYIIKRTPDGEPVKEGYIILILMLVLMSGLVSIMIGQNAFFGPFILGLAVPDGPPLGMTLVNKLDPFASELQVPVLIALSGLQADVSKVDPQFIKVLVTVIVVSLIGKIAGVLLPALYCRIPFRDSLSLALIMCGKGLIELATYNSWFNSKIIDTGTFTIMIFSVVVVTGIITPLVKSFYDPSRKYIGYIKRTIQHSRKNGELRLLTCIHDEESVPAVIKLLEASNPTRESPLYISVVHLVELVGRAAPVLITHHMWKKKTSNPSVSGSIVNAFRLYNQENQSVLSIQAFTTISPYETMHDDVCLLALDRKISLIILPFHKQWAADGSIVANRPALRTLNCNVLERAPCSVAVFVDRESLRTSSTTTNMHCVGIIFLGGADDREALAYGQRMVTKPGIKLKVVRLVAADNSGANEWQKILDDEAIKSFKLETANNGSVQYLELKIKDVEETSTVIRSMESENDLIMVGRRYEVSSPLTAGFSAWSECPELGIIGDMLASSDFRSKVSVLVVQQQTIRAAAN